MNDTRKLPFHLQTYIGSLNVNKIGDSANKIMYSANKLSDSANKLTDPANNSKYSANKRITSAFLKDLRGETEN